MPRLRTTLLLLPLISLLATTALAIPRWHFEDRFSRAEQQRLKAWVSEAEAGLEALLGPLPWDYRVYFHRSERGGEPVPWANTWKSRGRAVYFHVDMDYDQDDFLADWTAPHELTHLIFPYLGEDSRWFAEGIASYLQYPIMHANGVLTWPQAVQRYENRFRRAAGQLGGLNQSIVDLSRNPRGAYVRLYWGGAAYFLEADRRLQKQRGRRLTDVIRQYMDCCYSAWGEDADSMIRHFDRITDSRIFSETYADTVARSGFPDTRAGLDWLREHPPVLAGADLSAFTEQRSDPTAQFR